MTLTTQIPSDVINPAAEGAGPFGTKTGMEHTAAAPKNQQIRQSVQPIPATFPLRQESLFPRTVPLDRRTAGDRFADCPADDLPVLRLRPALPLRIDLDWRTGLPLRPAFPLRPALLLGESR